MVGELTPYYWVDQLTVDETTVDETTKCRPINPCSWAEQIETEPESCLTSCTPPLFSWKSRTFCARSCPGDRPGADVGDVVAAVAAGEDEDSNSSFCRRSFWSGKKGVPILSLSWAQHGPIHWGSINTDLLGNLANVSSIDWDKGPSGV